jgi:AcrR family transcriptional regulator
MRSADRREQLLDATKDIVDRSGFHAVSIEAVAREAGITRPIVYSHFKDLAGLLDALVHREGDRALAQLADVLPTGLESGGARDKLLDGMRAYLRAAQADPVTWRLVLMPVEGAPPSLRERITEGRRDIIAQLAERVPPELGGTPDPELTANMLSLLADENVRLHLADPEHYDEERLMTMTSWFLERILAG